MAFPDSFNTIIVASSLNCEVNIIDFLNAIIIDFYD